MTRVVTSLACLVALFTPSFEGSLEVLTLSLQMLVLFTPSLSGSSEVPIPASRGLRPRIATEVYLTSHESLTLLESTLAKVYQNKRL